MFQGSMVALVTPMHADGAIDKKALQNLIEWHIASQTNALIIAGTTGESATLTTCEHADLIATAVHFAKGRIPIIAGTGSNSTAHTIELTLNAKKAGADACLIVTPYYNKPTQNGLYVHYKTVADETQIPIILYNVPSRTGCDLLPETVGRLASLPYIIGIKEATGKLERISEILQHCDPVFSLYSGDDLTAMEFMLLGGRGVISVTANIAPKQMRALCDAALANDQNRAEAINANLLSLHRDLFLESNPIPTKWLLHEMGFIAPGIRLPLLPLDPKFHELLRKTFQAVKEFELIEAK